MSPAIHEHLADVDYFALDGLSHSDTKLLEERRADVVELAELRRQLSEILRETPK